MLTRSSTLLFARLAHDLVAENAIGHGVHALEIALIDEILKPQAVVARVIAMQISRHVSPLKQMGLMDVERAQPSSATRPYSRSSQFSWTFFPSRALMIAAKCALLSPPVT